MAECFALFKPKKRFSAGAVADKHQKVLKIVKIDGKILELKPPVTVKDLLVDFSGFGVAVSETASQNLPPTYELKMGKIYYLRRLLISTGITNSTNISSAAETEKAAGGVKRIKVVITKQHLQELLSQQISVEDVLSGLGGRISSSVDSSSTCWKPKLETIPEVSE